MKEDEVRASLLNAGVPSELLEFWTHPTPPLSYSWTRPNFAMAEQIERLVPSLKGLCPIFSENGEAVVGYVPATDAFVRFHYEDGRLGDIAVEVMGHGFQQFALQILLEYEDAGLVEFYDHLVRLLHFSRGPDLRTILDEDPDNDERINELRKELTPRERGA